MSVASLTAPVSAQTVTWLSPTTGGTWSVGSNWTTGTAPTTTGTAVLGDATANRTVFTVTSGTVGRLTLTQTTANVLNEFRVGSNFTVTNAVTLGASSGTARFTALPSGAGNVTAIFTNGITVNGGGQLLLAISSTGGSHVANSSVSGNVTVAGGYLEIARFLSGSSAGSASMVFNNGLAMSSGTMNVQRNASSFYRTTVTGSVNITGGAVVYDTGNRQPNWVFNGTSIVMRPDTLSGSSGGQFLLGATTSATATFGQGWNQTLSPRGTGVKTVSMDSVATPFLNLRLQDDDVAGTTSLRLGSNLTFSNLLEVTVGVAAATQNFAIDTNGYTATFSSQPFTVVSSANATDTVYDLVGSGTLSALGFTLNTGSTTVNVGSGLTLVANGSDRVNTLSGSGTIDPTSTFRYAALGTGTLVSTRAIGNVEVTSGTLRITGLAGAQEARAVGGTLDLNNSGYTFGSVLLADGAITSGTLTSAGLFDLQSGTASAVLAGAGGLTKSTAGTVTLSGANTYAGDTNVNAGGLMIDGSQASTSLTSVASAAWIGGAGSLAGGLTIASGGLFAFNPLDPTLDVSGAVSLDTTFGVASLVNPDGSSINWSSVADGTYTLIGTTTSTFNTITNFGPGAAADIGGGRTAYFTNGSLNLVIVPEPGALALAGLGIAAAAYAFRRRT